jgi:hypothetical protein
MKRLVKWFLDVISRKIAEDYASGENGWDKAVKIRRTAAKTRIIGV